MDLNRRRVYYQMWRKAHRTIMRHKNDWRILDYNLVCNAPHPTWTWFLSADDTHMFTYPTPKHLLHLHAYLMNNPYYAAYSVDLAKGTVTREENN